MGMETSGSAMRFGKLKKGERNLITDVPGVKVGHFTLHEGESHTGITCIIPGRGDVFHAESLTGLDGHHVFSLPDALERFGVN